jgi:hypothetical protein
VTIAALADAADWRQTSAMAAADQIAGVLDAAVGLADLVLRVANGDTGIALAVSRRTRTNELPRDIGPIHFVGIGAASA